MRLLDKTDISCRNYLKSTLDEEAFSILQSLIRTLGYKKAFKHWKEELTDKGVSEGNLDSLEKGMKCLEFELNNMN